VGVNKMGCVLTQVGRTIKENESKLIKQGKTPAQRAGIKRIISGYKRGIKAARGLAKKGYFKSGLILVASGVIPASKVAAKLASKSRNAVKSKPKKKTATKPSDKIKEIIQQKTPSKVKVEQKINQQLNQKPATEQIRIIKNILLAAGATALVKKLTRQIGKTAGKGSQTQLGQLRKWRLAFRNWIRSRQFVFTPDLISLLFGLRATKAEARKLTKRGRIFTGFERRKIV